MASDARFARIPEPLLDAGVSSRAIHLYAILDRYAGADGMAYPRRAELAARLGCSLSSVDRALAELVDAGELEVESHADEGMANHYYPVRRRPRSMARHDPAPLVTGDAPPPRGRQTPTSPVTHPPRHDSGTPYVTGDAQKENHSNESHLKETLLVRESSSDSRTSRPGSDDDLGLDTTGFGAVDEACRLVAEHDLEERIRAKGPVSDEVGWLETGSRNAALRVLEALERLGPDALAPDLAAHVIGRAQPRRPAARRLA